MKRNGFCIWLTGLPSAGKTTIAREIAPRLRALDWNVEVLDGDEVRQGLSADLGFDRESRERHASRVTYVAKVLARNSVVPIVALISPYRVSRASAREAIGPFVEVYVDTPLELCERRDVKGLYAKARRGELLNLTGIDDPYEVPEAPDITVDTGSASPAQSAEFVIDRLRDLGWLAEGASAPLPARPNSVRS